MILRSGNINRLKSRRFQPIGKRLPLFKRETAHRTIRDVFATALKCRLVIQHMAFQYGERTHLDDRGHCFHTVETVGFGFESVETVHF